MCGISGFVCCNNELGQEDLFGFNKTQSHRGPDYCNVYYDGQIGLAHQRLKIIDLSAKANQPMESHCKRYVMIYNGEVYNFKEILKKIQNIDPDFIPVSSSDTEIVLQAFAIWGESFVNMLNGMFAIAILDKQSRELYLFRDRLGIKPIYYFHHQGVFAFASELKAFSENNNIKKHLSLNKSAINQFLHLGYIPSPHSIYKEVKKIPSGNKAKFANGELSVEKWWKAEDKITETIISNEADALKSLREIVESAVSQCLVSDVPFGTFLSGGIDSSLVTAIAQKYSKEPINTFSIAFGDSKYNEAPHAKKVSSYLKTNHHEFEVTQKQAQDWIPSLMEIYDEPFADSSALPTLLVSKLAREHVTMVLSGDGGDELFMGYGSYVWARRLANPVVPAIRYPLAKMLKMGNQRMKRASHLFEYPGKHFLKSHIFSQEQYFFSEKEIDKLLNHDYRTGFCLPNAGFELGRKLSKAEDQALFDLNYYLPDDLLVKVDRASMHFSLETRVPLLDYRLVEFALNLDEKLKIKKDVSKYLLRKLLYEYLPEEYFDRPKWGFAIPLGNWMKNDLKDFCEDHLSNDMINKFGLFNTDFVDKIKSAFYKNNQTYLYNRLWQLVVMQMWLNKH